jgi:hypothetical protein
MPDKVLYINAETKIRGHAVPFLSRFNYKVTVYVRSEQDLIYRVRDTAYSYSKSWTIFIS